ncbi:MAG: hypothetical protein IPL89_14615 [Acidobacteria bacterium]|nr:hypothetical protein [Acidobacteriota bacterium]
MNDSATGRATRTGGWSGLLSRIAAGLLVYLVVSGLPLRLIRFSPVLEWTVLLHTLAGFLSLVPVGLYLWRHYLEYRADALTPSKVLGYCGLGAIVLAEGTGLWVTALALFSDRVPPLVRTLHLIPSVALAVLLLAHLWPLRKRNAAEGTAPEAFSAARRGYVVALLGAPAVALLLAFPASLLYDGPKTAGRFPKDYRMPYGQDRPFAPSLARTESNRALAPEALAGSASCGAAGCHPAIYAEWSVSAHRWAALDPAFQRVQEEMGKQNGPESTRYCGGCHDPISLFSGAKVVFKEKLTEDLGFQEGISCLSCHAVEDRRAGQRELRREASEALPLRDFEERASEARVVLPDPELPGPPRRHPLEAPLQDAGVLRRLPQAVRRPGGQQLRLGPAPEPVRQLAQEQVEPPEGREKDRRVPRVPHAAPRRPRAWLGRHGRLQPDGDRRQAPEPPVPRGEPVHAHAPEARGG